MTASFAKIFLSSIAMSNQWFNAIHISRTLQEQSAFSSKGMLSVTLLHKFHILTTSIHTTSSEGVCFFSYPLPKKAETPTPHTRFLRAIFVQPSYDFLSNRSWESKFFGFEFFSPRFSTKSPFWGWIILSDFSEKTRLVFCHHQSLDVFTETQKKVGRGSGRRRLGVSQTFGFGQAKEKTHGFFPVGTLWDFRESTPKRAMWNKTPGGLRGIYTYIYIYRSAILYMNILKPKSSHFRKIAGWSFFEWCAYESIPTARCRK